MSNMVECTELGSFRSYGVKPISTAKPGIDNYYIKDVYKDISNYQKRKIGYLEDRVRKSTVYEKDLIKTIRDKDYFLESNQNKINTNKYDYLHDENIKAMATARIRPEESQIRERFAQSTDSFSRKKMFTNWTSTYDATNNKMLNSLNEKGLNKDKIKDWFKNTYHTYHRGSYETESMKKIGVHGDNPNDKFSYQNNLELKDKLYSDSYDTNIGTTKTSNFIPGYSGFIPVNNTKFNNSIAEDPYFRIGKSNHKLTYNIRLPGYKGYIPTNPQNIKGNIRPYCLSTRDEKFS